MQVKDRGVGKNSVKTVACARSAAKSNCSMPEWKLHEIEHSLLIHLRDVDFSSLNGSDLKSKSASLTDQIASLRMRIADIEKSIERTISFIKSTDLTESMRNQLATELSQSDLELSLKRKDLERTQTELQLCDATEKQMDSGQLQRLLKELKSRPDDYDFRANFNNALRMAISRIELTKDHFTFHPWEYEESDIEVIEFRRECPSRKKISLNEIRKRIKFAKYCESLARRIVVRYKNGAVRHVELGTGFTYINPIFKRRLTTN